MSIDNSKSFRLLNLYEKLNRGDVIKKKAIAEEFGISEKSVQRDIDDLRVYLAERYESGDNVTVEYDHAKGGYVLIRQEREVFTNEEIMVISKILLESRGLNKEELNKLIDKLLLQATPGARLNIKELILNERFHYIPPRHGKPLINTIWELSGFIHNKEIIEFDYTRKDGMLNRRRVKPLAIMFSELYFYLITWMADDTKPYPTVFRVDRIAGLKSTGEKFRIPYSEKFSDGEFRKRVQFMFSGELRKIRFKYDGPSIEAILDRIPTAEILSNDNGEYLIEAESYGEGILMWLRTQGVYVKLIC